MATVPAFRSPTEQRRLHVAAAIALFAELAIFGGAWALLEHKPAPPPARPAPPLIITLAAPAVQPAPVAEPAPRPATEPAPQHTPAPQKRAPATHVAARPRHVQRVAPQPPAAVAPPTPAPAPAAPTPLPDAAPTPTTADAARPAAPPAAAAKPSAPSAPSGPSPTFEGALRAAIEAALRYPEAARMAGMAGRTRVAFHYRDGMVSDVTVVVSSGTAMLDRAALAAVRDANCPKPDPAFAGKTLSEQLWVNFNLNNDQE